MKKTIVLFLVLALAAVAVSAETYFGAWGRAVFVPFAYDGNKLNSNGDEGRMTAGTGVGWDALPNMAFYFSISGEKVGFEANWDFAASDGPNQQGRDGPVSAWWKPSDWFKMQVGWAREDRLRGPDTVDSLAFLSGGMWDNCDIIFQRTSTAEWWAYDWDGKKRPGAILSFTPVEGLYLGTAIYTGPFGGGGDVYSSGNELADVFKTSQYVAGYEIKNIGLVRAGYHGMASSQDGGLSNDFGPAKLVQLAFSLTAVEGLTLDLGYGYALNSELADRGKNNMQIGLAAGYKTDMFSIDLNVAAFIGGDKDKASTIKETHTKLVAVPSTTTPTTYEVVEEEVEEDAPVYGDAGVLRVMLTPALTFSFGTIGANLIFGTDFSGNEKVMDIGAGLWYSKDFGGGSIKTGVALHFPAGEDAKPKIAIPFELTYSIW